MLKNRVYRACASDVQTSPPHQVKFLFSRLHELVPTNNDCYLCACNGSFCIIDRYRPAVAGSRVLIDVAGRCEWARIGNNPQRIVTDCGQTIEGNQLQEAIILGVVIREVVPTYPFNRSDISLIGND
ncbi:hypothetical protein J3D56_002004 [Erwinia persicina]|jgi:hypothetical protein|uniref:hypothetical protein n=1 Tax=Erwinia TaxID=551 RepID=UPI00209DE300|nr:hypothetical protein [Erwinia persicina]MCP1438568.1 hypothetical protein [Erwinia persicina]